MSRLNTEFWKRNKSQNNINSKLKYVLDPSKGTETYCLMFYSSTIPRCCWFHFSPNPNLVHCLQLSQCWVHFYARTHTCCMHILLNSHYNKHITVNIFKTVCLAHFLNTVRFQQCFNFIMAKNFMFNYTQIKTLLF